jgi:hypothetical protein
VFAEYTPTTKMGVDGASFKLVMKHRRTIVSQAKHGKCQLSSLYIIIGGKQPANISFSFHSLLPYRKRKKIGAETVGGLFWDYLYYRRWLSKRRLFMGYQRCLAKKINK